MQPYRLTTRAVPCVRKAACTPSPTSARTLFTTAPFFPHFNAAELNPLFRILDAATAELAPPSAARPRRSFTPRFDVREVGQSYELQGELPGLEQKDLTIEFVDERTLVVRGRRERESEAAAAADVAGDEAKDATAAVTTGDDAASEKSATTTATFQRASVEDEDYVDAGADEGTRTPTSETAQGKRAEVAEPETSVPETRKSEPEFKYWVSERAVGEFERRFAFPGRVDQEAVKASLRNGILSVVVPKIVEQGTRRIEIQ